MTSQPGKGYKHRVVVEITTSKPVLEGDAVRGMRLLLDRIDTEAPIWFNDLNIRAVKLQAKSFSRVVGALFKHKFHFGRF